MSEEGSDGRQQEIRLTPPPRVEPVGSKLGKPTPVPAPGRRPGPTIAPPIRRGRPRWVAPLAFGLLILMVALAVYLLPAAPTPGPEAHDPGTEDVAEAPAPSRTAPGRSAATPAPAPLLPAMEGLKGEGSPLSPATEGLKGEVPPLSPAPEGLKGEVPPLSPAPEGLKGEVPPLSPATEGLKGEVPPLSPATSPLSPTPFGRAMAEGLAAIDSGDLATAREAFARAAAIDPDSPQPAAGLERVEAAASGLAIEELRARASGRLAAEAWHEAAAAYRAALEIDPTLTFAREGLAAAEARGALSDRLAYHLERPERLAADEVLSEVEALLETARGVEGAGPRHAAQLAALEELAARFRWPVRVALVSDGRTEVTVHQVGRLGTFSRRELELRPGTYTVVGSRTGYRDVRRQLKVEPGAAPQPFEIRCEEKL